MIPEITDMTEIPELFRQKVRKGQPYLVIKKIKRKRYCHIEYNFITTQYQLKETARQEVAQLFTKMDEIEKEIPLGSLETIFTGKIYGRSTGCKLRHCRSFAYHIMSIITNTDNWELQGENDNIQEESFKVLFDN